jgi:protein TonB
VKAETKPEPPKPEPAKPVTAKAEPKSAARRAEEAKPAPAPPQPEWKPPEPPREPPREEPKAVAAATTAATPVSRSSVNFPASAAAKNIDSGVVKARVTINAAGLVTGVEILEARPRRYFDEEATRSLREWRFNAGADNRHYDVEIAFQR